MRTDRRAGVEGRYFRFQAPSRSLLRSTTAIAILLGLWLAGGISCGDAAGPDGVVASVTLEPASAVLEFVSATVRLTATAGDANGNALTGKEFTWESSADSIATVSRAGLVTAAAVGTTTVSATTDGVVGTAPVIVTQLAATIAVDPATVSLTAIGQTQQYSALAADSGGVVCADKTFTWESSDENVVTVSSSGLVTAVMNGVATITATADGVTGSASATVQLVPWVEVTPDGAAISGVGATHTFTATAFDADGNQIPSPSVTWSSLNPNIVTVDAATGVATAVASGQATIVAEVDGLVDYALLTVSTPGVGPVTSWSTEEAAAWPLEAVWGTSSSDVYAVGRGFPPSGVIWHYDGTRWSLMTSPTNEGLLGVWGTSPSDVYAVGSNGTIVHYDGTTWSAMTTVPLPDLQGIWGTSAGDVYAVGNHGVILRGTR